MTTGIRDQTERSAVNTTMRWGLVRHSLALTGRELTKVRRNPGIFLDALFMPVTFLLLFVYLFGGAVSGSTGEYLRYLFPGIMVMSTVLAGLLATGMSINRDIKKGVFDRFRSMPIGRSAPLIGSVVADSARYVVTLVTLFAVGYLMGFRVETDLLSALAACGVAVTLGFSLSWISVFVGVLIKEEAIVQTIAFLGIFPLAFGTSMVAPTETMPGWLRAWIDINPVTHGVEAVRGLLVGGPVAGPVTATLLWSAGFLVVLVPLSVWAYQRRV
ncbi:ABC transporter permease [Glycomyces arizonensis]|uniref:ABC transporter permease n=1 Tax=Glycomyces arizonensis TaxID=256035 RepID=UPI0003FFC99D|nr:ABC transporter permease [Glycomyces arizonensis]